MHRRIFVSAALLAAIAAPLAAQLDATSWGRHDKFVVANRGSSNLTLINARTAKVDRNVAVPAVGSTKSEPMYVVQVGDEVWVGDRGNDRVVRFSASNYSVKGSIAVGKGVFHMWADRRQVWVVNDVDKTVSVINARNARVLKTVAIPSDLANDGYKPHDVWVSGSRAWVSLIKAGSPGYVVQYSTRSFRATRRAQTGGDPHLWYDIWTGVLYVATQNGNAVEVRNGSSLRKLSTLAIPTAHGIFSPRYSRQLYVTSILNMGADDLNRIEMSRRGLKLADKTDTGVDIAHNIATSPFGDRIAVTHSGGMATKVTIFEPTRRWWRQTGVKKIATLTAGTNPFGLAYVRTPRGSWR